MPRLNFKDMSLRTKLAVLITVLGAPIFVLAVTLYRSGNAEIDVAAAEHRGLTSIADGPMALVYDVQRHRLLAAAVLAGERSLQGELDASTAAIDSHVARLAAGAPEFGSAELVASVGDRWEALKATPSNSPEAVIDAHTALIEQSLIPLIFAIGNDSSLYRDPAVNTLNTSIGVVADLLRASEADSLAAAQAILGSAPGAQGERSRADAAAGLQAASSARDSMTRWLDQAMSTDPAFHDGLATLLAASDAEAAQLAAALTAGTRVDVAEVAALGDSALEANEALFAGGAKLVGEELGARRREARSNQFVALGFSLLGLVAAIAVALGIAASIIRPMQRLAYVADQMSLGQLDIAIDVESKNEIGRLAESLRRMQASLAGAMVRLRARRAA